MSNAFDLSRYGVQAMTEDWMEKHLERRIDQAERRTEQAERRTDQVNKRIDRLTEDLMWGFMWFVVVAVIVASAAAAA